MNNQIVYNLFYNFVKRGFSVLRFNFRGVGRSQGAFDHGQGELSDAAAALDWAQAVNPDARDCWIAGVSFGAWIGMQLLMRRPEIEGFISIAAHGQPLRFLLPRPLPVLRPVRPRLRGPRRAGQGGGERHREGEDPEGHQDRARSRRRRQPLLRRQGRRADDDRRRLPRRAPRQQAEVDRVKEKGREREKERERQRQREIERQEERAAAPAAMQAPMQR